MIKDTLSRLEAAIKTLPSEDKRRKAELTKLLSRLKAEIGGLTQAHGEQARSIAGFAAVAAHEATRKKRSKKLVELSARGLGASVKGFETSHPALVDAVNDICVLLSRLGI